VHECLRQIAAHLVFVDVLLLGVDSGGAGVPRCPFEPSDRLENLALLVESEGAPPGGVSDPSA
jgi:hypothetical protein